MAPDPIRNFGVVAHIDAGKTTLSEQMLWAAGAQHRCGAVDDGDTTLDWMEEERERGITITAAAVTMTWRGHQLNLIDTPGHVDFQGEVERVLRVLDGAVLLLDGTAGVQVQTEAVHRELVRRHLPTLCFANKLDRPGADFDRVVASLQERLGVRPVAVHWPVLGGVGTQGVVDLVTRSFWPAVEPDEPFPRESTAIPAALDEEAEARRQALVEELAASDDELLTCFCEGRDAPASELLRALRRQARDRTVVPVLGGAAVSGIGVQGVLDAIVDFLPGPSEAEGVAADEAPVRAQVFKVQCDPHGDRTFVRVLSGTLRPGTALFNPRLGRRERIVRVLRMRADRGSALDAARPGDIVALAGPSQAASGDLLTSTPEALPDVERVLREPVLTRWVEPCRAADRARLGEALRSICREDPSLWSGEEPGTGRFLLGGMGELHLEVAQHHLERDHRVRCSFGAPRVEVRERVRACGSGESVVAREFGPQEVFGAVSLRVEPDPDAKGVSIHWDDGGAIPPSLHAAVEEGLLSESTVGPVQGAALTATGVTVTGGRSEPRHNHPAAFAEAASRALRQALAHAGVDVLEPWSAVDVTADPSDRTPILQDLRARHAEIEGVEQDDATLHVHAALPLRTALGYATRLRSLTHGRGTVFLASRGSRPLRDA
ncbi:MAG: GTP-binding protein [Planctomycetota bacterium]|nr:GTP-binding protein [Planctomycetota bacterium]MDA0934168.1 GTP-binding protein [Planctomycetota bacterium]